MRVATSRFASAVAVFRAARVVLALALCAWPFAAACQYDNPAARAWEADDPGRRDLSQRAYLWRLAERLGHNGGPREFALAAHVRAMAGARDLRIVGGLRLIDAKTQRWLDDAERMGRDDPVVQILLMRRFSAADPVDRRRNAILRWRDIDSDNLAPLLAGGSSDIALTIDQLLASARSTLRADFYFDDIVRPMIQAVRDEPPPAALLATMSSLNVDAHEAFGAELGSTIWSASADVAFAPLVNACRGEALDATPRRRADCRHVAAVLSDQSDTLLARGIGLTMRMRASANESELREAAIAYRRHHWRIQQRMVLAQRDPVDEARMFARMLLDDTDLTEVELVQRMIIDAGLRSEPVPGWAAPLP
ncbi:MAG: hypothetical protein IT473_06045 [Lysobacter sp.]|nr:hypothetical protein [Lysobacter sp.]